MSWVNRSVFITHTVLLASTVNYPHPQTYGYYITLLGSWVLTESPLSAPVSLRSSSPIILAHSYRSLLLLYFLAFVAFPCTFQYTSMVHVVEITWYYFVGYFPLDSHFSIFLGLCNLVVRILVFLFALLGDCMPFRIPTTIISLNTTTSTILSISQQG